MSCVEWEIEGGPSDKKKLDLCVHGHMSIQKLGHPSNGSCFQHPLKTISISLRMIHLHFCGTTTEFLTEAVSSAFP